MAKTHRRIRYIDNDRNKLATLVGSLCLVNNEWRAHGMAGPEYDHLVCCLELISNPLPVILTGNQERIPSDFAAVPFQHFRELLGDRFVLVRVTYKNLNHALAWHFTKRTLEKEEFLLFCDVERETLRV